MHRIHFKDFFASRVRVKRVTGDAESTQLTGNITLDSGHFSENKLTRPALNGIDEKHFFYVNEGMLDKLCQPGKGRYTVGQNYVDLVLTYYC